MFSRPTPEQFFQYVQSVHAEMTKQMYAEQKKAAAAAAGMAIKVPIPAQATPRKKKMCPKSHTKKTKEKVAIHNSRTPNLVDRFVWGGGFMLLYFQFC